MDVRISASSSGSPAAGAAAQPRLQAYKDLGSALKAGDADAAKTAYAALTANAKHLSDNPNSPMARLGKALEAGNLESAQQAYDHLHTPYRHATPAPGRSAEQPAPATATTGGRLNVVA